MLFHHFVGGFQQVVHFLGGGSAAVIQQTAQGIHTGIDARMVIIADQFVEILAVVVRQVGNTLDKRGAKVTHPGAELFFRDVGVLAGNVRVTGAALQPAHNVFYIHLGVGAGHHFQLGQQLFHHRGVQLKGLVQIFRSFAAQEQLQQAAQVHVKVFGNVLAHHIVHILADGVGLFVIGQGGHGGHIIV